MWSKHLRDLWCNNRHFCSGSSNHEKMIPLSNALTCSHISEMRSLCSHEWHLNKGALKTGILVNLSLQLFFLNNHHESMCWVTPFFLHSVPPPPCFVLVFFVLAVALSWLLLNYTFMSQWGFKNQKKVWALFPAAWMVMKVKAGGKKHKPHLLQYRSPLLPTSFFRPSSWRLTAWKTQKENFYLINKASKHINEKRCSVAFKLCQT